MGGLALAHTGTRRYKKDEFYALAAELVPMVEKAFNTEASLVVSYRNKESFGDMDILVLNSGGPEMSNAKKIIQDTFKPKDIIKNTSVVSFDYKELQIDLIFTPTHNWETSKVFFAYNDLGNLMGKVYHRFGLKYGFDGVKYIYRVDNDRVLDEILVTKDMERAFAFLGLSWERFQEGFDDLEDIFEYVISSPYFNPDSFKLENLNAINKRRNKRRKVYNQFVEYVKDMEKKYDFFEDRESYIPMINMFFPEANLAQRIIECHKKEQYKKALHEKFNGNLIMERFPELKGPALGKALGDFKKYIAMQLTDGSTYDDYIESSTSEVILSDFENFLKDGKN